MDVTPALRRRREDVEAAWRSYQDHHRPGEVRPDLLASWDRSSRHVKPTADHAPVGVSPTDAAGVMEALVEVEDELRRTADDCDLVVAVTDPFTRIVWTAGGRTMRRKAEQVNFVPGGRWDETSIGTNALALALRERRTTTVWSAEHFSAALHGWVCYAAPIVDPRSGRAVGVLDFSTTWDRADPMARTAVTALARTLSAALPTRAPGHAATDLRIAPHGPSLRLSVLGRTRLHRAGAPIAVSGRQAEILLLLAAHPDGLSLAELHALLYGDLPVTTGTVKAEISHLRHVLGGGIGSRPYRLLWPMSVDALDICAAVRSGQVRAPAEAYTGPVLPRSDSPGVTALRVTVEVAVRDAVLACRDTDAAAALAEALPDDPAVQEHAFDVLAGDPRRHLASARLAASL